MPLGRVAGEAHGLDPSARLGLRLGLGLAASDQAESDVLQHAAVGQEAKALEHHAD